MIYTQDQDGDDYWTMSIQRAKPTPGKIWLWLFVCQKQGNEMNFLNFSGWPSKKLTGDLHVSVPKLAQLLGQNKSLLIIDWEVRRGSNSFTKEEIMEVMDGLAEFTYAGLGVNRPDWYRLVKPTATSTQTSTPTRTPTVRIPHCPQGDSLNSPSAGQGEISNPPLDPWRRLLLRFHEQRWIKSCLLLNF